MIPAASSDTRLDIARSAARLFVERGVAATGGDEIAAAAGVSTRTVWRHFRNKESCIGPLLVAAIARFGRMMRIWPLDRSLEDHLRAAMPLDWETAQTIADGVLAARLVALASREPDIRAVWLDSYHQLETELRPIVSRRCNRSEIDFDVRLCAATIVTAIRIVDEDVTVAAMSGARQFEPIELAEIMAAAIRDAATLPICDPVPLETFARPRRRRAGLSPRSEGE
jgi:AcrR family transcriptional regulator